jgi:hypothetical protein
MHTVSEILELRNERGIIGLEGKGWAAVSRDGTHMITFYEGEFICSKDDDEYKFYKNERIWAKRIVGLLKRGY